MTALRIDPAMRDLISAPSAEERQMLAASIVRDGLREPLVVWAEEDLLLDGHTRHAICTEHGVPYAVVRYSFPDREAAEAWVLENALARRNLSEEQRRYVRGKRLLLEKRDKTLYLRAGTSPSPQCEGTGGTAERIAESEGVSRATVERDAVFATAVDEIAQSAGPEAKASLLSGETKATRAAVKDAAARKPQSVADLKRLVGEARPQRRGPERDTLGDLVRLATRTATALRAYVRAGAQQEHREQLLPVFELAKDTTRLDSYLED